MSARYEIIEDRTGRTGVTLRGAALALWKSRAPEVLVSGPAETGKTVACCHKLDALLWKYAGSQAVMARKVRDTIHSTCLQTYRNKVLTPDTPVVAYGGERPQWFDYPNGSRLWLAGLDDPGKALSSERDFVYVNQTEELTLDDWQVLTTRTTGRAGHAPYGQCFGDCNPGPPHHWIKSRASLTLLESRHEDNPTLWNGREWTDQGRRTLAVLDALTGVRKERLRHGRWVSAEGVVYDFDPARHRVTAADLIRLGVLTADGRRGPAVRFAVAGVDWGYTAPGVLGVWLGDGDGRIYLVAEEYRTQQLIGWWVERAKTAKVRYGVEAFVCDPAEPAYIEEFRRAGLPAVAGDNDRKPGIQSVQSRLQIAADGRPRLLVLAGATAEPDATLAEARLPVSTEQEFDSFAWKRYPDGRPNKEETVGPDHGLDAARYVSLWADRRQRFSGLPATAPKGRGTLVPMPGRW